MLFSFFYNQIQQHQQQRNNFSSIAAKLMTTAGTPIAAHEGAASACYNPTAADAILDGNGMSHGPSNNDNMLLFTTKSILFGSTASTNDSGDVGRNLHQQQQHQARFIPKITPSFLMAMYHILNRIMQLVMQSISFIDMIVLVLCSFFLISLMEFVYYTIHYFYSNYGDNNATPKTTYTKTSSATIRPFPKTWYYTVGIMMSQLFQIALVVYIIDIIVLIILGFSLLAIQEHNNHSANNSGYYSYTNDEIILLNNTRIIVSNVIYKVVYIIWFVRCVIQCKRFIIQLIFDCIFVVAPTAATTIPSTNDSNDIIDDETTSGHPATTSPWLQKSNKNASITILNRIIDTLLYIGTLILLLEIIDVELIHIFWSNNSDNDSNTNNNASSNSNNNYNSIKSILAIGSATTILIGLGFRDLSEMIVQGLTVCMTNRITVGDDIKLQDGTTGVIQNIGWIQTTLRHYDNIIEFIPNHTLGKQRVKNISRTNQCRVQQILRFHYDDALLLPTVLDDIIDEIRVCCPELITDGSRPLRAVMAEYCDTYIKVIVVAHFNIKPIGKKFCHNRQQYLLAIYRTVVEKHKLRFVTAIPINNYSHTTMSPKSSSSATALFPQQQPYAEDLGSCG